MLGVFTFGMFFACEFKLLNPFHVF